jgi:hypothetical protein
LLLCAAQQGQATRTLALNQGPQALPNQGGFVNAHHVLLGFLQQVIVYGQSGSHVSHPQFARILASFDVFFDAHGHRGLCVYQGSARSINIAPPIGALSRGGARAN